MHLLIVMGKTLKTHLIFFKPYFQGARHFFLLMNSYLHNYYNSPRFHRVFQFCFFGHVLQLGLELYDILTI